MKTFTEDSINQEKPLIVVTDKTDQDQVQIIEE